jgi:hypothetical protein
MWFLNPLFLLGMAALAAPVLVHLVRRTRARRVEFPAIFFVRQVPQRTIRRRTLHNLLLLAMRCLALLLVVLAFTRPFFTGAIAARGAENNRSLVILLDSSLSMRESNRFEEAKRRAQTIADEALADEKIAVASFGESFEVLSRFTTEKNSVTAAIARSNVGFEGTDYEQALRGAEALFVDARAEGQKRVVLISDFQATAWRLANSTFKLGSDIRVVPIDVGANAPANVAVTNVEANAVVYGPKYLDKLAVHISNFSDDPRDRLLVDFQINEQTVEKREISLAARESRVLEFTAFNLAEGSNRCLIAARAEDFSYDNNFYFALRSETPSKALILDGGARGRGESFYLQNALASSENLPFSFETKNASSVEPATISERSLIILNDVGSLPGKLADAIVSFVEAGGQLVIATGPQTNADAFNQAFKRIAPVTLREPTVLERGDSIALADVKMAHPVFEVFRGSGRLASARVFGYHRSDARENAAVLARFEDGSPALVESAVGSGGRVLLFSSTLGMSWSDLPLTPTYLPFVQQMVRYLGKREVGAWHRLGQAFHATKDASGSAPAIDTPAGVRLKQSDSEGDTLVTAREPGFYRLRYDARPDFVAINIDSREGVFSKLNLDEFLAAVSGEGPSASPLDPAAARFTAEETEAKQRVWWPLLALALLLFAAEAVLSRRTKMVKMVG